MTERSSPANHCCDGTSKHKGSRLASGVCHTDIHAADGDWPVKPKLLLCLIGLDAVMFKDEWYLKWHLACWHATKVEAGKMHGSEGDFPYVRYDTDGWPSE